ncbi:hypothetical protein CO174_01450 [Candidatus Uhrbacteria bacterium CG_4_9_14_3_um_filter_50_9]|uniref:Uncharacterized protein n=1 Tax=Candidatus Uhrbacteria bacterium CG_4_9_14_3_um_filter_50_9 TaxID=1975035 RepID=A0A2M7XDH5_9BACT|nr:MAG: hypothetical protein CO174_01450 [Candidatus Uhrbacteria bacterium CG_4_9_14_3_um_filter_50_9]
MGFSVVESVFCLSFALTLTSTRARGAAGARAAEEGGTDEDENAADQELGEVHLAPARGCDAGGVDQPGAADEEARADDPAGHDEQAGRTAEEAAEQAPEESTFATGQRPAAGEAQQGQHTEDATEALPQSVPAEPEHAGPEGGLFAAACDVSNQTEDDSDHEAEHVFFPCSS